MKYKKKDILAQHSDDAKNIEAELNTAEDYYNELVDYNKRAHEIKQAFDDEFSTWTEETIKEYSSEVESLLTNRDGLWRDFEMHIDTVQDMLNQLMEDDESFQKQGLYTEEESVASKCEPVISQRISAVYCKGEDAHCDTTLNDLNDSFSEVIFFYRRDKDGIEYCDVIYKGEVFTHELDTIRNQCIKTKLSKETKTMSKKNTIPENAIPILSLVDNPANNKETKPAPSAPAQIDDHALSKYDGHNIEGLEGILTRRTEIATKIEQEIRCLQTNSKARKYAVSELQMILSRLRTIFSGDTNILSGPISADIVTTTIKLIDQITVSKLTPSDARSYSTRLCEVLTPILHAFAQDFAELNLSITRGKLRREKKRALLANASPIDRLEFPAPVMPYTNVSNYPSVETRTPELIEAGEWLIQQPNQYVMADRYFTIIDAVLDDCPCNHSTALNALMSAYTRAHMKFGDAESDDEIKLAVTEMVNAFKDFKRDVDCEDMPEPTPEPETHAQAVAYIFKDKDPELFDVDKYYTVLIKSDTKPHDAIGFIANGETTIAYVVAKETLASLHTQPHGYLVAYPYAKRKEQAVFNVYQPSDITDKVGCIEMTQYKNGKPDKNMTFILRPTSLSETNLPSTVAETAEPTSAEVVAPTPVIEHKPSAPTEDKQPASVITIKPDGEFYRIITPTKPDRATINAIKSAGFKWFRKYGYWSAFKTSVPDSILNTLRQLKPFGGDKDAAEPSPDAIASATKIVSDIQEKACNKLIESLNNSEPLWLKTWFSYVPHAMSYSSDHWYSFDNQVLLLGHKDYYLTLEGARKVAMMNGHTDPGLLPGAPVYHVFAPALVKYDPDSDDHDDDVRLVEVVNSKGEKTLKELSYFYQVSVYPQSFFNHDAVPIKKTRELKLFDNDRDTEAERIVKQFMDKYNIRLNEIEGSASPTTVSNGNSITVNMPSIRQFKTSIGYYAVLFHELTHAANRVRGCQLTHDREELSAEIGSWIILNTLGFHADELIGDVAEYCNRYIKVANEKRAMKKAFSHAKASADLILVPVINKIKQEQEKIATAN